MSATELTLNPSPVAERRIRTVLISPALLFDMCKQGNRIDATCIEGIPGDAIFVDARFSAYRHAFELTVAHPSFSPVPGGFMYPEMTVTFQREER